MVKRVLVTGAAGFIGMHVCKKLEELNVAYVGMDNFNPYYDPQLKRDRAKQLAGNIEEFDLIDGKRLENCAAAFKPTHILHLAAQAGVQYSIENPQAYVKDNIAVFVTILELAAKLKVPLVYASSSSVYGAESEVPYATSARCDTPVSLYAATKRANELMAHAYNHIHGLSSVGLRFFTVYGPWGRPDMAYFRFAKAIYAEEPITLHNYGQMERDFTYIDDIVKGVIQALDVAPGCHIYNLGATQSRTLEDFVSILEEACGKKASRQYGPLKKGDVLRTFADVSESTADLGFVPTTGLEEGLKSFIRWYAKYYASKSLQASIV